MSRLADQIDLDLGDGKVTTLSPSLRAAYRIARDYKTFGPVLLGIQEGSVTVLSRVIGECGFSPAALPELLIRPGASLAARIAVVQPVALQLILGLLGVDPDCQDDLEEKPAQAEHVDLVTQFADLFGFATGILKWTPAEAWAATPAEIIAALEFRRKAFAPKDDPAAKKPHHELTLDQQAELFAAQLQARFGKKTDAV